MIKEIILVCTLCAFVCAVPAPLPIPAAPVHPQVAIESDLETAASAHHGYDGYRVYDRYGGHPYVGNGYGHIYGHGHRHGYGYGHGHGHGHYY